MRLLKGKKKGLLLACGIGILSACNDNSEPTVSATNHNPASAVLDITSDRNLIIPVTIENKTWHFLVDTGSSFTILNQKVADEITKPYPAAELPAFYRENLSGITTAYGSMSRNDYAIIRPRPLTIGSQQINDDTPWISLDLSQMVEALGSDIDGIIGVDTFRKLNWQVDNQKKRLLITREAPSASDYRYCTGYSDAYNSMPQLWLRYENTDIAFGIDTGCNGVTADREFIQFAKDHHAALMLDNPNDTAMDGSGLKNAPLYIFQGLTFNQMPLAEVKLEINQNQQYSLGMGFLARFARYAFIPSRLMFCYDADSLERHELASVRHIKVRYNNPNIEVFYNDEAAMDMLGIRNGDVILALNGISYPPAQIDRLREKLALTPAGKLKLKIQRAEQQMEITL